MFKNMNRFQKQLNEQTVKVKQCFRFKNKIQLKKKVKKAKDEIIEPGSPALQADSILTEPSGKLYNIISFI